MIKGLIIKWTKMHDAAKSSLAFAVSAFIVKGISFLSTPIFTRMIESSQYGLISTYNSWVSIIEVFALLGMTSAGVFNVGLKDHKEDRNQFISSILILCNLVTTATFILLISLKRYLGDSFIQSNVLLAVMFVHFIFHPAQIFWMTKQRYEYKYRKVFLVSIGSAALSQLLGVVAIQKYSGHFLQLSEVKIISTTMGLLLFEFPIYCMLIKRGKTFWNYNIWKTTLFFAIPLLPHYLAQHVMGSSDRIMVSSMYSPSGAAIYSVVCNISLIATIMWSAVNASLIPYTFEAIKNGDANRVNGIIIHVLIFYSIICISVSVLAPEIILILAPKEYFEGVYAVPPIIATAFLSSIYNIYANVEFYNKKSLWIAVSTIIAALINIILNIPLIPRFGYVAAAYTTLLSQFVLVVFHYIGYLHCETENFYYDKIIMLISVISVFSCIICSLLYKSFMIRYLFIVLLVIAILIKHEVIIGKIKEIRFK